MSTLDHELEVEVQSEEAARVRPMLAVSLVPRPRPPRAWVRG